MLQKRTHEKNIPWEMEEENTPYSYSGQDSSILQSVIFLLKNLLLGKKLSQEMLSDDIVNILRSAEGSEHNPASTAAQTSLVGSRYENASSTMDVFKNKGAITKQLFKTIKQKTVSFLEISRSPDRIIYADPSDPENTRKRIEYRWNATTGAWKIIAGSEASAFIPDETHNQLITIDAGKTESYGTGRFFEVNISASEHPKEKKAASAEELEDTDRYLTDTNKQLLREKTGQHRLYAFAVPEDHQNDLLHYAGQFANERCEKGRSVLLGNILQTFQKSEYPDLLDALSYTDTDNNFYVWKDLGQDGKLGLRYKPDGTVDVILPDTPIRTEHLVFIGHKDVNDPGFAGGQLLYVKKDGSVGLAVNSNYDTPKFSGHLIRLSKQEMAQHLDNAKEAARSFLNKEEFIAKGLLLSTSKTSPHIATTSVTQPEVIGAATARLDKQRSSKPKQGLPENIKVAGHDGAPVFEMHCAFRQEVFKIDKVQEDPKTKEKKIVQIEQGPIDEDGKRYAANVYVMKKTGSDISKDRSHALIIEISDAGEIRFRSGWTGDNFVQAKITVKKNGQEYVATIGTEDDWIKHDFDEKIQDTPFRSSNDAGFMCVRGCLENIYDENNKRIIENPALAKTLDI